MLQGILKKGMTGLALVAGLVMTTACGMPMEGEMNGEGAKFSTISRKLSTSYKVYQLTGNASGSSLSDAESKVKSQMKDECESKDVRVAVFSNFVAVCGNATVYLTDDSPSNCSATATCTVNPHGYTVVAGTASKSSKSDSKSKAKDKARDDCEDKGHGMVSMEQLTMTCVKLFGKWNCAYTGACVYYSKG